jgi:protein O-GlcNAc transferase
MTTNEALALAIDYHQKGSLTQAEQLYRQILQNDPNDANALNLLGVIAYQTGKPETALHYLNQAISAVPGEANFHVNLALVYRALGKPDKALASFQYALRLDPNAPAAHNNLGNLLRDQKKLYKAAASYRNALRLQPNYAEAHNNLGAVLHEQRKLLEAAASFQEALRLKPGYAQAHTNLGNTLAAQDKLDDAVVCHRQALRLQPNFADAMINLGNALQAQGELDQAVECYRQALRLQPASVPAYVSLGAALAAQDKPDEAVTCYRQALRINHEFAPALHGLGAAQRDQGMVDAAIASQRQAIRIAPDYAEAHAHLGHALVDALKLDEALASYEQSLRLKPDPRLRVFLATLMPAMLRSTSEIQKWRERLTTEVRRLHEEGVKFDLTRQAAVPTFYLAYHGMNDRDLQREIARLYDVRAVTLRERPAGLRAKIRIGFISRYFKNHTIGWLMRGLIAKLSREFFDVTVLSVGAHSDAPAQWIREHSDHYVVLPHSVAQARHIIAQQQLDVLFYTDIGMDPVTYSLAFSRLAPVQCATWGHPVTTGIETIDFFISSQELDSAESDEHYTEKLVRLKNLAIYYYRPAISGPLQGRAAFGLPESGCLYACPQSLFKIHPEFDDILGDILRQDPTGSLVLIQGKRPSWKDLLRQRFAERIPDVLDRIFFVPQLEYGRFLNLNALADVLLDPIHFGGGNTSYEGFALGLPIVTLPSPLLRARITRTLYQQMGVMDCIVNNPREYVELAVRLGTDRDYCEAIKEKIKGASDVLFENASGVRELEEFLQNAVAGATP